MDDTEHTEENWTVASNGSAACSQLHFPAMAVENITGLISKSQLFI